jgi:hypothetical protein
VVSSPDRALTFVSQLSCFWLAACRLGALLSLRTTTTIAGDTADPASLAECRRSTAPQPRASSVVGGKGGRRRPLAVPPASPLLLPRRHPASMPRSRGRPSRTGRGQNARLQSTVGHLGGAVAGMRVYIGGAKMEARLAPLTDTGCLD